MAATGQANRRFFASTGSALFPASLSSLLNRYCAGTIVVFRLPREEANAYIARNHRHNKPTNGHKWSVACYEGERLCGVAAAGQLVARKLDDGLTGEIRRVCTDGTPNACSILYGACARIARNMGYKRVITYTLDRKSVV